MVPDVYLIDKFFNVPETRPDTLSIIIKMVRVFIFVALRYTQAPFGDMMTTKSTLFLQRTFIDPAKHLM